MTDRFRLAFLGVDHPHGAGWRRLLQNLEDRLEIVAIVPAFGGAEASLEQRLAGAARFETVAQLVAWGAFDGAMVCLPNNEAPAAIASLAAAGKHVLAEKPVAATPEAADRLAAAVAQSGIAFQAGYTLRFDPAVNALRDMVSQGRFGVLINVEMSYVTSDVRRRGPQHYLFDANASGGGFFSWLACHYLDLLLYVTGQRVVGVTARCGNYGGQPLPVEDGGAAILELAEGGLATLVGGYWFPRWAGENRWSVRGSERWVNWVPQRSGTAGLLEIHGPQPQWYAMEEEFIVPPDPVPGYGGRNALALVEEWLAAAESGTACRAGLEATTAAIQLVCAIYQASQQGRRLEVEIGP